MLYSGWWLNPEQVRLMDEARKKLLISFIARQADQKQLLLQ